jgi:hypothetical protein
MLVSICVELVVDTGLIAAPEDEANISVKKHEGRRSQKPELSKPNVLRTGLILGMGP